MKFARFISILSATLLLGLIYPFTSTVEAKEEKVTRLSRNTFPEDIQNAKVLLHVHHVGQGNFVSLKLNGHYMIVDAGSKQFGSPLRYMIAQKLAGQKTSEKIKPDDSIKPAFYEEVTTKAAKFVKEHQRMEGEKKEEDKEEERPPKKPRIDEESKSSKAEAMEIEEIKENIKTMASKEERTKIARDLLGEKEDGFLKVKTVVIIHPHADHYNHLPGLFPNKEDKIEHIILPGLPSNYQDKENKFLSWLQDRVTNGTKVHWIALKEQPKSIKDFDSKAPGEFNPRYYADTPRDPQELHPLNLDDAFNFGEDIKVDFLVANPAHETQEEGKEKDKEEGKKKSVVVRSPHVNTDPNSDNLILKVTPHNPLEPHKSTSLIIQGDPSEKVIKTTLDHYKEDNQFIQSDIQIAGHHGSAEGQNTLEWVQHTKPAVVLISNGHHSGYKHPHEEAYNNFSLENDNIQYVDRRHEVFVWKPEPKSKFEDKFIEGEGTQQPSSEGKKYPGTIHKTSQAIFSTLDSGTITASLDNTTGIKLFTENPLELVSLKTKERSAELRQKRKEPKTGKEEDKEAFSDQESGEFRSGED